MIPVNKNTAGNIGPNFTDWNIRYMTGTFIFIQTKLNDSIILKVKHLMVCFPILLKGLENV